MQLKYLNGLIAIFFYLLFPNPYCELNLIPNVSSDSP